MLVTTDTFTLDGIEARPVRVEVDVQRGLPAFTVVGLPDVAVREGRERLRAALANCGFEFPMRRIVANLAPASLRKAGPGFDLPLAVGVLAASGQLRWEAPLSQTAMVGELALDGSLRPVDGALAMAEAARDSGAKAIIVPFANGREAALAEGIEVLALDSLARVAGLGGGEWTPRRPKPVVVPDEGVSAPDFADLRGQPRLRFALEVAAAGGHNLLMVGPPGAGRSLAASRFPSILPSLSESEALEVARIAGVCGRFDGDRFGVRPFRAPHHTVSPVGLVGGGTPRRPGEATLAHLGVLYLDELAEFRRDALEAVGSFFEARWVVGTRDESNWRLPGRFLLLAGALPCPCGRGEGDPECSCTPLQRRRYKSRLRGVADRIDIVVDVQPPTPAEIAGPPGEPSSEIRSRVMEARLRQHSRLGQDLVNAEMTSAESRQCALTEGAAALLADRRPRGREHDSVVRLARTVADLAGSASIGHEHLEKAFELRGRDVLGGGSGGCDA